jgi:hypothetical protein
MKFLSDKALKRLRDAAETPDLSGTRYRLLEEWRAAAWASSTPRKT